MKRNILYIFNDNNLGGAALSLLDTLAEIREYVNAIIILRDTVEDEVSSKFEELGSCCYKIRFSTDYVNIGKVTDEKKENEFKQSYEAALQLLPIIKQERIHLIHINSSVSYFAALAALMAGIPYVWHIRELMEEQFGCEFLDKELKHELYIQADKLIAISNFVSLKYQEKFSLETKKIYDGLDIKRFRFEIDKKSDFGNIFLAAAAVISAEKGQIDAIKAVERLVQQGYTEVRLMIVGSGNDSYVWALKKYIKKKGLENNISILPFRYDLAGLRKEASYEIICSQNEALGRVTIEAMLAGNIVIGARNGGTTEIIGANEERGYLYELHNSEDLADTMIRAINTAKGVKDEIVNLAQTYAETIFDSRKYCNELLQVYDQVINSFVPKNQVAFLNKQNDRYKLAGSKKISGIQVSSNQLLKLQAAFNLSVKWIEIKQGGHNLQEYFDQYSIKSIAIYGMAALGRRLYDELEGSHISIKYLIDKNPDELDKVMEFTSLNGKMLEVDAIVVTVAGNERNIVEEIKSMGYGNVIGLSSVLNALN